MNTVGSRVYLRAECVTFRKTDEPFGGLSNMAPGYPLIINQCRIRTAEALYQSCRFPHLPEVQKMIINQHSPMTAKMKTRRYYSQSRPDWFSVRNAIMRWVIRAKLIQHYTKFSHLLLNTGSQAIVEEKSRNDYWGAKPIDSLRLEGPNVLGRLLMELREFVRDIERGNKSRPRILQPLFIDNFHLLGEPINAVTCNELSCKEEKQITLFDD